MGGPTGAEKDLAVPAPSEKAPVAGEGGAAATASAPTAVTEAPAPATGASSRSAQSGTAGTAPAEASPGTPQPGVATDGRGAAATGEATGAAAIIVAGPATVTRGSNLRADSGIEAAIIGFVRAGERVQVLDDKPVRGYYRVAFGARKGWIWGPNIEAADPGVAPTN